MGPEVGVLNFLGIKPNAQATHRITQSVSLGETNDVSDDRA
jgi:hypothetical protein